MFVPQGTPAHRFENLLIGFEIDHRECKEPR